MAEPLTGFREGDLIVTAVSDPYSIGQIKADGTTQEYLASEKTRADALARACRLAGAGYRVFLWAPAGESSFVQVDCEAWRLQGSRHDEPPTAPAPRRSGRYGR